MSGFAVWGSLRGYGPYANTTTAPLLVAGYILAYSIMAMIVSAAIFQQRKQIENLYGMYYRLKSLNMPDKEVSCEEVEEVESRAAQSKNKRLCGRCGRISAGKKIEGAGTLRLLRPLLIVLGSF